jgi:hypothetical protein
MGFFSGALWWAGNGLIALVMYRGRKGALVGRYPYFYSYVASVAGSQLVQIYLSVGYYDQAVQKLAWWILEFVTAVVGFGVTWEIYRHVLWPFVGVRRMARAVLASLFGAVVGRTAIELAGRKLRDVFPTSIALEQNLRAVQALLLVAILGLIVHYGLPIGRNLWALLTGYGFFVGANIVSLTVTSRWHRDMWAIWAILPQIEYCITLVIWCVGMWAYSPNPMPDGALECDYEHVSAQTARAFGRLRTHLIHSWRI